MTADTALYDSLCLTAEEEDAILDEAVQVVVEAEDYAPFDSQLKGLPDDDEIVQIVPTAQERVAQAREADRRLRNHLIELLHAERPVKA